MSKSIKNGRKQCYLCHKTFDLDHFVKKLDQYGKERYFCKENLNKPKKKKVRKGVNRYVQKLERNQNVLKYKYNITIQEFQDLLKSQDYKCLICENPFVNNIIDIDHNHDTGKIRGFLCPNCNSGIGLLGDNSELISNAITYLKKYL